MYKYPIEETRGGVILKISVRTEHVEEKLTIEGDSFVFYTPEPPIKGRANAALIRFLHRLFGISTSKIDIIRGIRSKNKIVILRGVSPELITSKIKALFEG